MKTCKTCRLSLDEALFRVRTRGNDRWVVTSCRPCEAAAQRARPATDKADAAKRWRAKDPERTKAHDHARAIKYKDQRAEAWAKYYAKHREQQITRASQWAKDNPERLNARRKARYAADPEHRAKVAEGLRESYQRHKAKRIAKAQAWAKANPDKRNAINNRRRALTRGVTATLTDQEWIDTLARYNRTCAYCGAGGVMTQDHVVPLKQGGPHSAANVVPACKSCNCRKQGRTPEEAGMVLLHGGVGLAVEQTRDLATNRA